MKLSFLERAAFFKPILVMCLSCFLFCAIAFSIIKNTLKQTHLRDIETLFSSVEAGALVFARSSSHFYSQTQLDQLLQSPAFTGRGLRQVKIVGGISFQEVFSIWTEKEDVEDRPECLTTIKRQYTFGDSIYPFAIISIWNDCFKTNEEISLLRISWTALTFFLVITIMMGSLHFYPILQSLARSQELFKNRSKPNPSDLNRIPFQPIREITEKALGYFEQEREMALTLQAKQIAHDLRAPLLSIEIITSEASGLGTTEKRTIQNSLKTCHQIISQVLNPQAKKAISQLETAHIEQVIQATIDERKLHHRGIDIDSAPIKNHGVKVQGSPDHIQRVIGNVLQNAIESSLSPKIAITTKETDQHFHVFIQDNGTGIPPEILKDIGKKRVSSTKPAGHGIGLLSATDLMGLTRGTFSIPKTGPDGTLIELKFLKS